MCTASGSVDAPDEMLSTSRLGLDMRFHRRLRMQGPEPDFVVTLQMLAECVETSRSEPGPTGTQLAIWYARSILANP